MKKSSKKVEKIKTPREPRMRKALAATYGFTTMAVAYMVLAVLAFAGFVNLFDGIDKMIVYPAGVVFVAFLLKETL